MKTLLDLPNTVLKSQSKIYEILPIKMSWEERKSMFICKMYNYYVSRYSCWQCSHFEVHPQMTSTLTKKCGHCTWPKNASKPSRRITADIARKLTGVEPTEEQLAERRKKRVKSLEIARQRRKESGKDSMADKIAFAVTKIKECPDKATFMQALLAKYETLSDAYCTTIYYAARKQANVQPVQKAPGASLRDKVNLAVRVYRKTSDRDAVISALHTKWPDMSQAYCMTLFYKAKREA